MNSTNSGNENQSINLLRRHPDTHYFLSSFIAANVNSRLKTLYCVYLFYSTLCASCSFGFSSHGHSHGGSRPAAPWLDFFAFYSTATKNKRFLHSIICIVLLHFIKYDVVKAQNTFVHITHNSCRPIRARVYYEKFPRLSCRRHVCKPLLRPCLNSQVILVLSW